MGHRFEAVARKAVLTRFAAAAALVCLLSVATDAATAQDAKISINKDFPGGNVLVKGIEGDTVNIAPDLGTSPPWFYWYLEATVTQPGRVNFVLPEPNAAGIISRQGPAVSVDGGDTWRWLGGEQADNRSFFYEFTGEQKTVRFSSTIPYLEKDLDKFLEKHASNPHLTVSVLTKSTEGREVELLRIGEPGPNVEPVIMTGRHHAGESIASIVFEGIMEAAMADTPEGNAFRKQYVLYAIPFVDKDGVEKGDQGKNRKPHDHNRDYGKQSIYPEIRAIRALDAEHDFRLSLDLHCPTIGLEDHQLFYFVGQKTTPPQNFTNVTEFARLIKEGFPPNSPTGPLVWLRDQERPDPMNSTYFALKDNCIMAATLEIPFAPPGKNMEVDRLHEYGHAVLNAWVNTKFVESGAE